MIYTLFFIILLAAELAYFKLADRFNIIDKPNQRSSHSRITIRGGGIVFYFGVALYSLWFGFSYPWFLGGLSLIAGISMADDIRPVSNRLRLLVHVTAMLLMMMQWDLFAGFPLWYVIPALVLCTGIINAYNFMDGINGITGAYSLGIVLTLIYLNQQVVAFIDPALLYTVGLALLVFGFFNFRRKARCFAGDVGSVSIAFIILFALGKLILTTGDLSYIILLALYGVDSVLTIVHRLLLGENIFEAHRKHAYQLMANELEQPHVGVAGFYLLIQLLINVGFVVADEGWRVYYLAVILAFLAIAYVLFMRRFFSLHQPAGSSQLDMG